MRIIALRYANTIENTTKTKPFGEFGDFRCHVGAHFGAPIPCWWTTNIRQFKGFGRFGGTCGSSFRASDFASATRKHHEFPRVGGPPTWIRGSQVATNTAPEIVHVTENL